MPGQPTEDGQEQESLVLSVRLPANLIDAIDVLASKAGPRSTRTDLVRAFLEACVSANDVAEEDIARARAMRESKALGLSALERNLSVLVFPRKKKRNQPARKPADSGRKRRVRDSATSVANSPQPFVQKDECENRTVNNRGGQHAA